MKFIKGLLLGAATGLVGFAVAQAAGLPRRTKGSAVQYVRICDTYGAGFFYVPGSSDTCIKVGGFLRVDYDMNSTHDQLGYNNLTVVSRRGAQNTSNFSGRFQVRLDVRTATEYGVLRAFGAGDFNYAAGLGTQGTPVATPGRTGYAEKAFIQFGGLTAGLATSFYDFYIYGADDYLSVHSSYTPSGLLAYTATFGGGFSATLSMEDPRSRSMSYYDNPFVSIAHGRFTAPGGQRWPDLVANLRVDQGWGSAQLSGALHQGQIYNLTGLHNDKAVTGFAVLGGLKINLPMLAAGDALYFEAAYADGATSYLGFNGSTMGAALQHGATMAYPTVDGVVVPPPKFLGSPTALYKTTGFNGLAALRHYWTPTFFTAGIVGYAQLDQAAAVRAVSAAAGGVGNFSEWRFGLTNEWVPVAAFSIGLEVEYARVHQTLPGGNAAVAGFSPNYGTWHGKLRMLRNF